MREYWNRPRATDRVFTECDGSRWFHTGDLGYLDEAGYLYVIGRTDGMIISGGENIYPSEIERVLIEHPDVSDVSVVGEQDGKWGERVVASVVTETSANALDEYLRRSESVAVFQRPREYYLVDHLPRNATGKFCDPSSAPEPIILIQAIERRQNRSVNGPRGQLELALFVSC